MVRCYGQGFFYDIVLVYKCVNGLAPDYSIQVNISLSVQQLTTGTQGDAMILFHGPREWNGLPDNIKNTKEIDIFKRTLNNMFYTK